MRKSMKKRTVILAAMVWLCMVSGCGAQPPVVDMNDTNMTQMSETGVVSDEENMTQMSETKAPDADKTDENMTQVSQNGAGIQENEEYVYFFGTQCIYIVDKATDDTQFLWKSDTFEPSYSMFDGKGLLLGEKVYFLERVEGRLEDSGAYYEMFVLSRMNADGSGYEQAVAREDGIYGYTGLYYSNGVLYLYNSYNTERTRCYAVLADGSLGAEIPVEETGFLYQKALGEEWLAPMELVYLMDEEAYFVVTQTDKRTFELVDLNTKERTVIGEIEGQGSVSAMFQESTLFYMLCDDTRKATVGYLSAEDGTGGVLFEVSDTSGYVRRFSPHSFGIRVSGDDLYYMDMRDYDAVLVRRRMTSSQPPTYFEEPLYRTNIHEVGALATEKHEIYSESNPDLLIGTVDIEWLSVDSSFAGSNIINEYLYESEVASQCAVFEDNVRSDEDYFDESTMPYSYDSEVACVRYFDGKYVSFVQECYDYFGGAHGMPLWEGYVFDLETGERLLLMDIVPDTEEAELKDLVAEYFGEMIDASPSDYWADAKETVRESVSLEMTDFVLTDKGICFYMHPYSISAYAMGFSEVTIPYTEFKRLVCCSIDIW